MKTIEFRKYAAVALSLVALQFKYLNNSFDILYFCHVNLTFR